MHPAIEHQWTVVSSLNLRVHARVIRAAAAVGGPIVLVSGLGVASDYWLEFMAELADRLGGDADILAPDLPGFGQTPAPAEAGWPGGPSIREQADQLLAWLDARGIERAVFVGHSLGCQIVADLVERFPERATKLVLAAPTYDPSFRTIVGQIRQLSLAAFFEYPRLLALLLKLYVQTGPIRVIHQAIRSMPDPIEAKLPAIGLPVLVLRGQYDAVVTRAWTQRVIALLPNGDGAEIPGAGHAMQHSKPRTTAGLIAAFLEDQKQPRPVAWAGGPRHLAGALADGSTWPAMLPLNLQWLAGAGLMAASLRRRRIAPAVLGAALVALAFLRQTPDRTRRRSGSLVKRAFPYRK